MQSSGLTVGTVTFEASEVLGIPYISVNLLHSNVLKCLLNKKVWLLVHTTMNINPKHSWSNKRLRSNASHVRLDGSLPYSPVYERIDSQGMSLKKDCYTS